jgi:hypothetical protein
VLGIAAHPAGGVSTFEPPSIVVIATRTSFADVPAGLLTTALLALLAMADEAERTVGTLVVSRPAVSSALSDEAPRTQEGSAKTAARIPCCRTAIMDSLEEVMRTRTAV